jgi:hypothetical protein
MRARKATVNQRRGRIIVERVDTTVDGIPVGTDDIAVFDESIAARELGQAVMGAVGRARASIPRIQRDEWAPRLQPLLRAAGVRSWRSFVDGCRDVSVFEVAEGLELMPSINHGAREGFEGLPEEAITVKADDPMVVGEAVLRALNASRLAN